ncbi:N-acetylgalactosamine 6-sulfate sulfatase [bacterium M21]|nr:N-acetylgalactosamine 6-sulfate sulfatase [bacterium M21]
MLCSAMLCAAKQPNVVLLLTDDQGYGDIGAHGNTMIQTPEMDRLWEQSIRLTNYHVDPTCTPTRAALMSGRYSNRSGVWHTIMGRSTMHPNETTIAEVFKSNGYRTGMFGKWHIGDNFPCRPEDQGFDYVVRHGGGGVGQGPDYWGNDYNDDTYWRNGKTEKFKGYCTDIWFREATAFVERNKERPFFCYLSTNAPHSPLIVDEKYSKPYEAKGVDTKMAKFYGMITNIDENLGKFRQRLEELGLAENTIFIFMTDNGTAHGISKTGSWKGFNAGMSGGKGSANDGGHRVPCFIYWPAGKLTKGTDVDQLTAHVDILPTLADLCGLKFTEDRPIDGTSLRPIIYGDKNTLRDRTMFVHSQRIAVPKRWRTTAVMSDRWRYVGDYALYDIKADPAQKKNVMHQHPEVVKQFRAAYDKWWDSLKPTFTEYVRYGLGDPAENPLRLMSMDWFVTDIKESAWGPWHVRGNLIANGPWAVDVTRAGKYRIQLCRWPKHLKQAMKCTHARFKLGAIEKSMDLALTDTTGTFEVELPKGPAMLQTWMTNEKGQEFGAYFVWVERLD